MKKRSVQLASLVVLVLALLIAVRATASGEPETDVTTCRYYYQLTQASDNDTELLLTVDRTNPDGRPLFMGYITLAVKNGSLQFLPADPWELTASPVSGGAASNMDVGTTSDGWNYISFCWQAKDQSKVDASAASQTLGTLTVPKGTTLDDIELLVWPETAAGKHLVALWEQAKQETNPDPAVIKGYLTDIESIWRMPDQEVLHQGYYQGYYAPEGPAQTPDPDETTQVPSVLDPEPEPEQTPSTSDEGQSSVPEDSAADDGDEVFAVDLTAGWQGFQVGAYAPRRPITLTFLDPGTKEPVATASYAEPDGTGHFKARMDFTKLEYTEKPEDQEAFIPDGKYDLKISKPSHVTCTIPDLEFENGVCVDLLGIYVELPCGDVDGDGFIGQYDRAQLTEPETYRMTYADEAQKNPNKEPCDLDGDHRVDQTDLSILIAPGNYGARDFIRKDVK